MAASDARPIPRKNTAYRLYFALRKNDGTLITSWAGQDSEVSLDGAAFADCTNEATEIGTSGCGYIDLTSSEMNADSVVYKLTVTNTGALPLVVTLFPEEAGDMRTDMVQISGDASAADNCELMFDGTGYAGGATKLAVDVVDWKGATAPAMTGDAYARLGTPAGASIAADIATRSTLTAADVWSHATRTLTSFGTLVADIWAALTSGLTTVGSIGKLLVDRIDETISSRSTYAGGDTSGTTELLTRLTSGRASNLDNLDAQVSSRLAGASYTAPLDASGTRSALGLASANLDTQLSGLPGAIADAVWDEATSGHVTPGTTGKALTDAGAAGVPPTAEEVAEAVVAEAAFKKILAMASGKVTKSGDAYTFYAEDNTTPLFTLTYTDTNRTVS